MPEDIENNLTLQQPIDWAYRRELIHQNTQRLYEEKFESNHYLNFHDLWEYINKKLQNEGENQARINSEQPLFYQQYTNYINEMDQKQNL